jgi:adenylate cyclase
VTIKAYPDQAWGQCDVHLLNLRRMNAKKYLYRLYTERVASMRLLPFDPARDGATNFETK